MATIVCLRRKTIPLGTDVYHQLDVVDGQQRLTTLILLLNAIKLSLDKTVEEHEKEYKILSQLLVKPQGNNLLLLQTNHDTTHHFSNYIRDGVVTTPGCGKTIADRQILIAIEECQDFVNSRANGHSTLIDLYACIKNRLSFILYEISDEKSVYTVFEVLNSRGIEVSWFDRLKSILMENAFELEDSDSEQLIKDLHTIWKDIYQEIGLRLGMSTEALRFAATLYRSRLPNRPLGERASVDEFRAIANDAENIRKAARWILNVTIACNKVVSNHRQNSVTRIAQARLLAAAIHLRNDISSKDRQDLLSRWEKVTFRIYGMFGKDARSEVGNYTRLAWQIIQENVSVEDIHSEIENIGMHYPIDDAVEQLRNANCYEGWQDELRYLMSRYEEYLTDVNGMNFENEQWERIWEVSASKSIEHIKAKSKASDDIKHRLGNLMMLPPNLNSKLQDKPTKEKFDAYRKTGLLAAIEVADNSQWTEREIDQRENIILEWAVEEWAD